MDVVAVVSTVVEKLAVLLIQEAVFLSSVKGKLEWIVGELRQIKCYLKGADAREGDENVKNWVNDLRDLPFEAEDVIEDYILRRKLRNAFVFNKMFILHKLGKDIEQIRNKISEILDRRARYGIENVASEAGQSSNSASERLCLYRQISHDLDEHDIVGFREDVNVLTTQLIEQPLHRCVISIIAMGGSGKSTLADKDLAKEFMDLNSEVSEKMTVEELKEIVREFLNGKKYLVVMDDVWTSDVWKVLKASLPDTKNGSRIVITTRIMEVTLHVDPLEELGRKIVKTCGGLPLAIVLQGGLLVDYEINARRLIRMWIAEGFIVQRGNEIVEDIAEEYLEELGGRCMVQITQRKPTKYIKKFRIHDLLRDLSISKAKEVGFLQIQSITTTSEPFTHTLTRVHRVVLNNKLGNIYVDPSYRHIRSFFHFEVMHPKKIYTLFRNSEAFEMLRVLDLSYLSFFKPDKSLCPILPKSLGKLVHLSRVKDGWDKCTNLKQLGLDGDLHLHEEDISNWIRNLDKLECLSLANQTEDDPEECFDPEEDMLKNPIERFSIFSKNHTNLYKLLLGGVYIENLPEPCDFPHNFSSFSLYESTVRGDIISTLGKLPNLTDLYILDCSLHTKEMVFSHGDFPKLQDLRLRGLEDLEEVKVEQGSLRSLRDLVIFECTNPKMLPDGLGHVTTLEGLNLQDMPKEFNGRVEKGGEDWEKVAHVPTIIICFMGLDLEVCFYYVVFLIGIEINVPNFNTTYILFNNLDSWITVILYVGNEVEDDSCASRRGSCRSGRLSRREVLSRFLGLLRLMLVMVFVLVVALVG
ncbi:hypothetical protein GIB67_007774 [Kingdonia uniflora]|uniref:Uncharacterized protein n=1 Tax=Kingdonia uniflora TaxID=39325 RepID=A0A7J7N1X1_9MAGN|nr:hypothetical protein GIB67_007774 [Kingdonia uniflora]